MYKRGEIVLIPVPFSDLSSSKKRPVLVLSNDGYNAESQDMVVVAVTSNLVQPGISITTAEMADGQLPKSSVIRPDKIYSLSQNIAVKSIGRVVDTVLTTVREDVLKIISEPKTEESTTP